MFQRVKINGLWMLLVFCTYFSIAYTVMDYYGITCVFLELFGVPCLGCGMTRAFKALLVLDLCSAVRYNVVVFFMPYVFLYVLFDFKHKVHKVLLSAIAAIAVVSWIIKLFT